MKDNEQYWILEYSRYGDDQQYKADNKEEALSFGCYQSDEGNIKMQRLLDPDGNVVMDKEELLHYYIHDWEY